MKPDAAYAEKQIKAGMKAVVNGKTYTKNTNELRDAFKKAHDKAVSQIINSQDSPVAAHTPVKFAKVNGFDVQIYPNAENRLRIVGPSGVVYEGVNNISAESVFNDIKQLDSYRKGAEEEIKTAQVQLQTAKQLSEKPFEYEKDLADAKEEADKISKEMEAEANNVPATGDISDEETDIMSKYDGEEDSQNNSGTKFSLSSSKFLVTNKNITGDTRVKVVDVTNNSEKINPLSGDTKSRVRKLLTGQKFKMESDGKFSEAKIRKDKDHFVTTSRPWYRYNSTRKKILAENDSIQSILENAIYVDRHIDAQHGTDNQYIDCYAAVRDGDTVYPVRIIAKDSNKEPGVFTIESAHLYDFYIPKNEQKKNITAKTSVLHEVEISSDVLDTISVSDLLANVKDRNGNPYVNADGSLSYVKRKYSKDEIKLSIKKAFPTGEITEEKDNLVVHLPNGRKVTISITDGRALTEEEAKQASKDYGQKIEAGQEVQGSVEPRGADAFMTLDVSSVEGTVDHEALHYAMATVLTPKEKKSLLKQYGNEEEVAEAYRKWKIARSKGRGTLMGKIFQKISDFSRKIASILNQIAEPSDEIYRKLESGEVFDRPALNEAAKTISQKEEIGSDQSMTKFSIKQKLQPRIDALKERIAPKLETGDRVSIAESTVDKLALPKQFRDYHVLGMVQSVSRYKDALTQQYFRWADMAKRTQAKLQGKWTRSHNEILDLIQDEKDTQVYTAILLEEDARKKLFSDDVLRKEFGASDNIIEAHKKVRNLSGWLPLSFSVMDVEFFPFCGI